MRLRSGLVVLVRVWVLVWAAAPSAAPAEGTRRSPRPLSPFAARFGNGCQTQTACAAIERLGLYAGASLQGTLLDSEAGRETALGGTLSVGFDFIRRVALEAHFATAVIRGPGEPLLVAAGPPALAARLRLGPPAPTLLSELPPPRWSVVLAARLGFGLPHAAGDPRHVGAAALYVPQPGAHAGLELGWGPAQLSPSVGVLGEPGAAYLQLGLRTSLRLARSLSVDLEAVSWLPAAVPDEPGRCRGGTRAGLGVRGALAQGILGVLSYSAGAGDCEPGHSLTVGATFAFGEHPLRRIPTPEEAGAQRLWLGLVDPVLDCNGWMLDEPSLLPLFKYGDPDPQDPTLIRRGEESFRVGEHFDIDRRGRLYRPHQYTALAAEHEFRPAPVRDKLVLPECAVGPRHRFHTECRLLADTLAQAQGYATSDRTFGAAAPLVMALQLHRKCLSEAEAEDPRQLAEELAGALAASRRLRPAMAVQPPPGPLGPANGVAPVAPARAGQRTLDESRLSHIFRRDPGHVVDTPQNRQRMLEVANRDENRLGTDRFGVDWYGQIHEDGTQTWVRVRNDKIINAGVNPVPRRWNPLTGLSAPEPPNGKR